MTNRTDSFDRADTSSAIGTPSDAGSAWSQILGTWGIASNTGYCATNHGANQNIAALESSVASGDIQVTASTAPAGGQSCGVCFRVANANNFMLASGGSNFVAYKRVAGTFTQIGSTYSAAMASSDVIKVTVDASNNITVYVNGVSRITATDSAGSTNTQHGIYVFNGTSARLNDFSFTGAGGGPTYTLTADSGSFALTGQTTGLAFNRTLAAASGSFTLTGQDAGLAFNRVLSAVSGSYALDGQDATLTYTPISGATYTLGAASGSFALTGQDTGLAFNRVLTADTQSYSLSGQTAGLAFNRVLTADTVSYALTGQDVTLTYTTNGFTYTLTAESGPFEVTGQDASLQHTTTAIAGGGGWLHQTRRKSRKQIYEERVKLGILPPPVIKAAAKVAAVAQTVEEFKEDRPKYEEMFLKAIKKTEWLPDYTRAIQAQLAIIELEEEELLLLL